MKAQAERGKQEKREVRQWWAVHHETVLQVAGYSCAPTNPDIWWCPQVGYSLTERHHLFPTELEALAKLHGELSARHKRIGKRLAEVRSRLARAQPPEASP